MKPRGPQRSKWGKLGSQIKIFFFKRENGAVPKRQKRKDSQTEVAGGKKAFKSWCIRNDGVYSQGKWYMTNKNQWGKVRCDLERGMVHGGEAEVPDKGIQTPFIYDKESWGESRRSGYHGQNCDCQSRALRNLVAERAEEKTCKETTQGGPMYISLTYMGEDL